jgi:hypothetical protein
MVSTLQIGERREPYCRKMPDLGHSCYFLSNETAYQRGLLCQQHVWWLTHPLLSSLPIDLFFSREFVSSWHYMHICIKGFFWWNWGLNSGLHTCKAGTTAWATPPFHFVLVILEMGSLELFARLASNFDPSDPSLLSSWDYRCEPSAHQLKSGASTIASLTVSKVLERGSGRCRHSINTWQINAWLHYMLVQNIIL